MKRIAKLAMMLALGIAGGAITAPPASAQIAAALNKPLPSPDLPVGTVTVRIVAGSAAAPVVGTEVTLVVNDAPRVARTDSAGRASFPGLPVGATVVAKVIDEDKAEHASDPFPIPDDGGTRVMITTKPWQAGAGGGAPFAGGAGGMPNPRQMSGEGRAEQSDAAGLLTIRVAYDDFKDTPEGVPVVLIGYAADDSTSYQLIKTDKAGRVQFADLDRSGGTSYFALALLPRNGATDRVMSAPVVLEAQVGVRMVLSGEKRSSTAPPVDDLGKLDPQIATPAGKVRVAVEGIADVTSTVRLVDAETKKVLGETKPKLVESENPRVQGGSRFDANAKLPPGTLDVEVAGGPGQEEAPLKDVDVRVVAADAKDVTGALTSVTDANGTVRMALPGGGPFKAVLKVNGGELVSETFDLTQSGGKLTVRAQWEAGGKPQAMFDVAEAPGKVVYAECEFRGSHFRSMPFQLIEGVGSKISVYAFPRVLVRFQLNGFIEDTLFAAQGKFEVMNYSWAPYRGGPDGLVIPMPHGFKGGVVFDPDQSEVSVADGEGFRVIRPIPPGGRTFHGGFSLGVEDGHVAWSLDLPMGAYNSQLAIREIPGMVVHTPPNANGEERRSQQGGIKFFVIDPISIPPKQSMVMSIDGLPSPAAWRHRLSIVIGLLVVAVMLAGVGYALIGGKAARGKAVTEAADRAHRQRLIDELVELESSGANPKRREQLLRELEQIWT
jgi:hypothetical protein